MTSQMHQTIRFVDFVIFALNGILYAVNESELGMSSRWICFYWFRLLCPVLVICTTGFCLCHCFRSTCFIVYTRTRWKRMAFHFQNKKWNPTEHFAEVHIWLIMSRLFADLKMPDKCTDWADSKNERCNNIKIESNDYILLLCIIFCVYECAMNSLRNSEKKK